MGGLKDNRDIENDGGLVSFFIQNPPADPRNKVLQNSKVPQNIGTPKTEVPQNSGTPMGDRVLQNSAVPQEFVSQNTAVPQFSAVPQNSEVPQDIAVPSQAVDLSGTAIIKALSNVGSLNALGLALILVEACGYPKGRVSLNALAKATGKAENTIRGNFKSLESAGILEVLDYSNEGMLYQFKLELKSFQVVEPDKVLQNSEVPEKVHVESTDPRARTRLLLLLKALESKKHQQVLVIQVEYILRHFFAMVNSLGKDPDKDLCWRYLLHAIDAGDEHALALYCEKLPRARENPAGYMAQVEESGAEPRGASFAKAESVLNAMEVIRKEIGIEVLPRDWDDAAKVLRIKPRVDRHVAQREYTASEGSFLAEMMSWSPKQKTTP